MNTRDPVTGGLRLLGDYCHLLTEYGIEEGGFTYIRSAYYCYKRCFLLRFKTMFQPHNRNNDKKGGSPGLLHLEFDKNPMKAPKGFNIVIDGLIFDDGFASSYHAVKGKPAGFDTGMWLEGPAKNKADKFPSANRYCISSAAASRGEGNLTIRNCTFVNGSNYAVNLNWYKGSITIVNNVFCNNRMLSVNVTCSNGRGKIDWECAYNTILFTWSRLNDLADMGFAIRNNENPSSFCFI